MYSGCERLFFFMATTTLIFPEVARAGVLIYSILSLSLSLSLTHYLELWKDSNETPTPQDLCACLAAFL